jgi:dTDP-4-dehydrorhamnose 3,5-epimerase
VAWDDPAVEADWGVADPILSDRDRKNPGRDAIEPQWRPHVSLRT